ncbi:MAG: monovalent cation/H(+) antiporter subunit G [Hyphomicrobiales bacterium]|nr:monovalent cation/H(+) antiporter subunit G [Hyphomicrobiales bacterium]
MSVLDIIGGAFLLTGCGFLLVGSIGLLRLHGFFARLHAASIIDTLGAGFLLIGLMCYGGFSLATAKLALILIFLLLTTPTAAHALAGAAHIMGIRPQDVTEESGHEKLNHPQGIESEDRSSNRPQG